jgi:hypothetical protein
MGRRAARKRRELHGERRDRGAAQGRERWELGNAILLCPLALIVSTWIDGMLLTSDFVHVPCRGVAWEIGIGACAAQAKCVLPDGVGTRDEVRTRCSGPHLPGETLQYPDRKGAWGAGFATRTGWARGRYELSLHDGGSRTNL